MPFDNLEWERLQVDETKLVPAPKPDPLIEKFQKAKELLQTKGWTQGIMRNQYGYCLVGALYYSSGGYIRNEEIGYLGFPYQDKLTDWNDKPWRFKSQVIRRLNKAIARRQRDLAKG